LFIGTEGEDGLFLGWVVVVECSRLVLVWVSVSGFEVDQEEGAEYEDYPCNCTCIVSLDVLAVEYGHDERAETRKRGGYEGEVNMKEKSI
jgi:hypothetical protein